MDYWKGHLAVDIVEGRLWLAEYDGSRISYSKCPSNRKFLKLKIASASFRCQLGFRDYVTDPMSKNKHRERRRGLKQAMPGIAWNTHWSHNDISTCTIALAQAMETWAPINPFSEPLASEVAIFSAQTSLV